MELSLLLAKQFASMMLMIAVGYGIVQIGLAKSEECGVLSRILAYVITPCSIFNAYQIDYSREKLTGLLFAIAAAAVIHGVFIALAALCRRMFRLSEVEQLALIQSNAGNLIIPLVSATLGQEWVFYTTAYLLVQVPLQWTHGKRLISGEKGFNVKNILLNVNVLAALLGFAAYMLRFRLPTILGGAVSSIGSTIGPVNMIVIGMLLAGCSLKEILLNRKLYLCCFLRLIVFPMVILGLILLTRAAQAVPMGKQILLISMLAASAPIASTVVQLAQLYNRRPNYAGALSTLSVVFCIVTMPLILFLYQWLV